ncbi:MAG: right-handed parallel beta-helix repeat-containing protein [Candidatus Margulisbacteria bacterium]|nr:right-handed parallel beta-helix repeat-containing protein [Candidatus Margulisiibacteriota bacterium]
MKRALFIFCLLLLVTLLYYGCGSTNQEEAATTTTASTTTSTTIPIWTEPAFASATADIIYGQAPLTVNFSGYAFEYQNFQQQAIGADAYAWDFKDGGTSSGQNPAHTFTSAGTYLVELTVTVDGATGTDLAPVVVYDTQKTFVSGEVSADTTWNSSGSPYILTGDFLTIASGKTLTISQNAVVVIDSAGLAVNGNLNAQGARGQEVIILSKLSTGEEGAGTKINLASTSSADLDYVKSYDALFELNSSSFSANNCNFYDSPLSFMNNISSITLTDNVFEHRKRGDKPAIMISSSNNNTIEDSILRSNAIGISISQSSGFLVNNCTINDNLCHNGIILDLTDAEVDNSVFNNNYPHAVLIKGHEADPNDASYAHEAYIHNNTMYYNHADTVNFEYYYGKSDFSTRVSSNEIGYDRGGDGVLVEYEAYHGNIIIEHNNIHHNGLEATTGHLDGITIENAGGVIIRNNTISSNNYNGINLNHGLSITIEANTISDNGQKGIILSTNSEAWAKNNTLTSNTIEVDSGSTLHQDY